MTNVLEQFFLEGLIQVIRVMAAQGEAITLPSFRVHMDISVL